jgi:signal transduction histidine kinase
MRWRRRAPELSAESLPNGGRPRRRSALSVRELAKTGAVLAAYVATGEAGLLLGAVSGFATLVWPPTGIALYALLRFGYHSWPGIFIGAFLVNTLAGAPVPVATAMAVGNTLEALTAAFLLRRIGFADDLGRIRDVLYLVLLAAIASTVVSATIGVGSLWLGGSIGPSAVPRTWLAWWIGDALGDLIVAPFLLVVTAKAEGERDGRLLERALFLLVLIAWAAFLFVVPLPPIAGSFVRRPYMLFPVLIWGALRFAQRGTVTAILILSLVAVTATVLGRGLFVEPTLVESLFSLQLFMAVATVTMLVLGAAIEERRRAIRAREDFISIASHELRTPLSTLQLQIAMARKRAGPESGKPVAIDGVARQVDRLTILVENLLDVSRVMAGRLVLDLDAVDLAAVVEDAVERLRVELSLARCELTLDLERCCVGRWDRLRLEQVVTNLLSNAAKYGAGSPIAVRVTRNGDGAVLSVRDHGAGISPADQRRIFDRFERAVSHRRVSGLGLGLWITRQIVTALGGTISLSSELGRGTELTVALPLTAGESTA